MQLSEVFRYRHDGGKNQIDCNPKAHHGKHIIQKQNRMEEFNIPKDCTYQENQHKRKQSLNKNACNRNRRQYYCRKRYALYDSSVGADCVASQIQAVAQKEPWHHPGHYINDAIHSHDSAISGNQQTEHYEYSDIEYIMKISPEYAYT